MNFALSLAKKNKSLTDSNPSVGSVLIDKNNNIISTGVTSKSGRPHAEVNCLSNINCIPNDSVLYVTLEPCSHTGKTPPCVDLIINKGIKNIVIGIKDSDERVSGNGIKKLKNAGVDVKFDNLSGKIDEFYKDYLYARRNKKPYITIKIATSLDGKISLKNGDSKWISSDATRKYTNFLRSKFDGILVSGKTYRNDKPKLTCRINGLNHKSPKRFILSNKLKNIDGFTIINGENYLDEIYNFGINSLLIEGGGQIVTDLLKNNLVNELIVVLCPNIIGNDGISYVKDMDLLNINDMKKFSLNDFYKIEDDLILTYTSKII